MADALSGVAKKQDSDAIARRIPKRGRFMCSKGIVRNERGTLIQDASAVGILQIRPSGWAIRHYPRWLGSSLSDISTGSL